MDYSNPLGMELRFVKDAEHNGEPARIVSGSRCFDTDLNDLWDAVTNPERIERWFLPVSGDLKPGGSYQLKGNAGGKVKNCQPPESFEVTWEYGENVSWLVVQLEAAGDQTKLTLSHIMAKDHASEEHWKKYGPGATGVGWDLGFLGLGMHLAADNAVIDQKESHEWMASEPGKVFLRQCATAWGAAHIESGESPEVANAIAEQTAKFYCGEQ